MASLPQLKVQLVGLEDQLKKAEKSYDSANRQYTIGLWGVLIGLFLIPLYGLGLLLVLAGGLAALTNRGKRASAKKGMAELELRIHSLRLDVANAESK
jgi:hypothetical protein